MSAKPNWRTFLAHHKGGVAVELGLTLPLFIILVIGAIQVGWALHCGSSLRWALERSSRSLLFDPSISETDLRASVLANLHGLPDPERVAVTLSPASEAGQQVLRAVAAYPQDLNIPMLPSHTFWFRASVTIPQPNAITQSES